MSRFRFNYRTKTSIEKPSLTLENCEPDFHKYGIRFLPVKNSLYKQPENVELKLCNGYWFEVPIKKNMHCNLYDAEKYNLSMNLFIYSTSKYRIEKSVTTYSSDIHYILSNLHKYLIELYIELLQNNGINITDINEPIVKKEKADKKPRKKTIPPSLKIKVWNKYIGEEIGKAKCLCCKTTDIYQASFSCGHIIAESNGGELNINNLKPIYVSCNSSMGTKNMDEYMKEYGF